jgi:hypothetical protein
VSLMSTLGASFVVEESHDREKITPNGPVGRNTLAVFPDATHAHFFIVWLELALLRVVDQRGYRRTRGFDAHGAAYDAMVVTPKIAIEIFQHEMSCRFGVRAGSAEAADSLLIEFASELLSSMTATEPLASAFTKHCVRF